MEERKPRQDEQLSTHKKKFQYIVIGIAGALFIIFFLNFLFYKADQKTERTDKQTDSNPAEQSLQSSSVRNSLLRNKPAVQDSTQTSDRADTSGNSTNTQTDTRTGARSPYTQKQDERRTGKNTPPVDPIKDIENKFKAAELMRALEARKPSRTNAVDTPRRGDPFAPAATYQRPQNNAERINHLDSQISANNDLIRQAESRVESRKQQGNQAIQAAENRIGIAQREAAAGGVNNTGVASPANRSVQVPQNVVGYGQDNVYQASTEGMKKLPVGSLINAITTMTAISDYQGGSMKAMLTHDLYDATNSYILAPKGSEFIIKVVKASNVNEVIQNRVAFMVTWLVLPNGDRIDFSRASGLDRMGIPAVKGTEVDRHILAQVLGVSAYALIGSKSSYAGSGDGENTYAGDIGDGLRGQGRNFAAKFLQIVPTVELHAGEPVRIITEDEIYVYPWDSVYEGGKYHE
ncbi:TrbI/VirB10 family protein [Salmonella enterica]|uniref:TrbI/VirB10 family protein n=1 Tax=Salmonella enterica TaxID=28901 RepID=A0A624WEG7_SALER|nr:TrbI/VirB10 family protein [Salmonella enterica]EBQ7940030.1 TrbI/VirB10 family protein [Salmonella enterica]ECL8622627.1 TrbI/VirB10 family protein [Salmonella enterica]ECP5714620.1 TrbI/VirB10 family protein [Salmonella enterica]ECZ7313136.1 TrbI/VirB10 family protein [Salmonella enterica]